MFSSAVTVLYLPEECLDGRRPLLDGVLCYYDAITDENRSPHFAGDELRRLRDVCVYIGEVQNGGHGQHLDNAEPSREQVIGIRDIFRAAQAEPVAQLVEQYLEQADARLTAGYLAGEPDYYALLEPLDRLYFALERESAPDDRLAPYVARLPWVKTLPGEDFNRATDALRKRHHLVRNASTREPARHLAAMIRGVIAPDPNRPWWKA